MKILVFDDTKSHRIAATLSLKGHDLTVVGTYDEAQKALVSTLDYEQATRLLPSILVLAGLPSDFEPYGKNKDASDVDKAKYRKACNEANDAATSHPDFDVVLTDLLVPASRQAQGPDGSQFVGQEMPLGAVIALLALSAGVTKVAVVTDMNHHNHPASAAFDCFRGVSNKIPGVSIICTNRVGMVSIDEATSELVEGKFLRDDNRNDTAEGLKKYPYVGPNNWGSRKGLLLGKDWGGILKQLLGEATDE
jgi:CheY-like chemotaxis protein